MLRVVFCAYLESHERSKKQQRAQIGLLRHQAEMQRIALQRRKTSSTFLNHARVPTRSSAGKLALNPREICPGGIKLAREVKLS